MLDHDVPLGLSRAPSLVIPDKRKRRYAQAEVGYFLLLLILILLSLNLFLSSLSSPSRSLSHPRSLRSSRPVDNPVDRPRYHHPASFKASSLLVRRSLIRLPKPVRRARSSFILIISVLVLSPRASDSRRSFGVLWTLFIFRSRQEPFTPSSSSFFFEPSSLSLLFTPPS